MDERFAMDEPFERDLRTGLAALLDPIAERHPRWATSPAAERALAAPARRWPGRLDLLLAAAVVALVLVATLAAALFVGSQRPNPAIVIAPSVEPSPSGEPSPSPSLSLPAPTSIASSCVVSTLAGKAGEPGAVDGTGAEARFSTEAGFLAWAGDEGVLYLADGGNHAIRKITADGVVTTVAGKLGEAGNVDGAALDARFDTPVGLEGYGDRLWIADSGNGSVRLLDLSTGTVTTVATGFKQPWGIAIRQSWSDAAVIYVSESDGGAIRYIMPDGSHPGTAAGRPGVLDWAVDGRGHFAGFGWPFGIAHEPEGVNGDSRLYIVDVNADRSASVLRLLDHRNGDRVTTLPFDVVFGRAGVPWVDATNTLYLTTFLDGTVVRRDSDGKVTLLAGKRGEEGSADGPGDAARFTGPMGIVGDGAGTLYVADSGNATIRTIRCP